MTPSVTRREVLRAGGSLVVAFSVRAGLPAFATQAPEAIKPVALDQVDSFLAIGADGTVAVYSGKVDLGTGVRTALTQIVADELDVPFEKITITQGDTLLTPDQGITWGSLSIQVGGMQIRQAAATARAALISEAGKQMGVDRTELLTSDGAVRAKGGDRHISYADLLQGKSFELKVDKDAPLKDPTTYQVVGKAVPRLDIPGKVTGQFTYMHDYRVPGMVHARVIRPIALGAQLISFDDSSARRLPGYLKAVRQGNFLAVVAENEWTAIKAVQSVRANWTPWDGLPEKTKLWEHVRSTKITHDDVLQNVGNASAAAQTTSRKLAATYDFAIHTHGSIGPSCAIAQWQDNKLTCWTASQQTHLLRQQLATMFGIPPEDVRALYVDGSGCYGRNGHEDAAGDAALLAKVIGRPVRVQWSRADEHGWDPKGPPTLIDYRGALDETGNVVAWESEAYIVDAPKTFAVPLIAAQLADLPPAAAAFPGNIHQGLAIPYTFPNIKATAHRLVDTPFRPSWIRTPGRMQNTFGNESFIDELASAAKVDPLEFRMRNLSDKRGLELLERLRSVAVWQARERHDDSGEIAHGRGVSYTHYELVRTYVGVVCDLEVNRKTGKIRVTRFTVVHDCGQIINPDGLRNQIEGNVIQTVSRTLIEELQFDRSAVTSLNWASYPIIRFPEVPEVVIELIDRPKEKPWGAGEPTASVVPSAISNAVFDAIGVRLRSVPFTPEKVMKSFPPPV